MTPTLPAADYRGPAAGLLWALVAAAIFIEQLADIPPDAGVAPALGAAFGWTAWACLLRFGATRVMRRVRPRWRPACLVSLAAAAISPPVALGAWGAVTGAAACPGLGGTSPEGVLLACLLGFLLTLLAVGLSAGEVRFAAATSLFLVAVSLIVVEHPAVRVGVAAYALVGSAWLVAVRGGGLPRRLDAAGLMAALAVAVTAGAIDDSAHGSARMIMGFMPLSGGTGWAFPWARGGSGDGEDLIAARDKPTATGPVDSEVFVTSHKPSLYDLMTDLYGEPERPKKDNTPKRAVGLGPEETMSAETHLPDSVDSGREFSTARRGTSQRRPRGDLPAQSLLTISGPVPVHLRLEVFSEFDGRDWLAAAPEQVSMADVRVRLAHVGGAWMRWHLAEADGEDGHEVTIGTLATPVLPLPAQAMGLRIDRIEQADFYREPQPGLISLATVDVPSGTQIQTRSKAGGVARETVTGLPRDIPPAARPGPARRQPGWVAEVVRIFRLPVDAVTWETAAGVVAALERHCVVDSTALPPVNVADTLEHFLVHSRRGPDFCFAGAAVLLLRELGFDARLVAGLYLSGDRRDPRSRKFVAASDDVHFWAEIRDAADRWVPVEATPGYSLREPIVVWWRPLLTWLVATGSGLAARPIPFLAAAMLAATIAALATWLWRPLVDIAATVAWRVAVGRGDRCPLRATWRLVESRAWLAGRPRPRSDTPRGWYLEHLRLNDSAAAAQLTEFITAFEQTVYGSGSAKPAGRALAQAVMTHVTRRTLGGYPNLPTAPASQRPARALWKSLAR